MMSSTTFIILITTFLLSLVTALPAAPPSSTLIRPRDSGPMLFSFCEHHNNGGKCMTFSSLHPLPEYFLMPLVCHNLDEMNDMISSYQVHNGCCALYKERDCVDLLVTADNTGDGQMDVVTRNDVASSWMCNNDCGGL